MNLKRYFKRNTRTPFFKALAGFGRAMNRLYENRNYDLYSNGELTILKKIATLNPSVIIDGGANTGKYSLLVNEFNPQTKIYAFEPVKNTYEKLKKNTAHLTTIIPIEKGLYKDNCIKEINLFSSDTHSSIYDNLDLNYESTERQQIELIKGDDFLANHQIKEVDFLKIDVEGSEYDAILGFGNHIENGKIKMIQFEYGYINISTKKLLVDFYHYFESKGYVLGKIFPKTVEFRKYDVKHEDFLGPNFIAVKKTETELINLLMKK